MARHRPGPAERRASLAVLSVLALAAAWVLLGQARFNPAVLVAVSHPKGAGRILSAKLPAATLTASFLDSLSGYVPLSGLESYGPETLSDRIDGKAELYLASGFQEMSCRAFAAGDGPGARVEVFVYAMESSKDAFAVFSGQRRPGADQLSLAPNSYSTGNAVFFTRDRFYAELVADRASPEVGPALEAMAQALLGAMPAEEGEVADPAALFPAEGLKKDTVRLAVTDALGMQGLENVYTADYELEGALAGAFLAIRGTPDEAAAQALDYATFLESQGFSRVDAPGAPPGAHVLAFDTMAQIVLARGSVLAGVHDAPDLKAALALAARLDTSLRAAAQGASK